jgi:hypothetical protein
MTRGQSATAYTSIGGGVYMVENKGRQEQVQVIHTIPKMTDDERLIVEKRVANDLFNVLSDIYTKLKIELDNEYTNR